MRTPLSHRSKASEDDRLASARVQSILQSRRYLEADEDVEFLDRAEVGALLLALQPYTQAGARL